MITCFRLRGVTVLQETEKPFFCPGSFALYPDVRVQKRLDKKLQSKRESLPVSLGRNAATLMKGACKVLAAGKTQYS